MTSDQATTLISITDKEFQDISSFVYNNYGIDLSKKRQLIEGRLSFTLKSKGMSSFTEYFKLLRSEASKAELQVFLNKITTNHSYFARENEHFDFLLRTALPNLIKTRKNELRIWSAGCSSGQEAYNIAMVIDQFLGPQKKLWDTTILATDISTNVLEKAQLGIYPAENLTGLPPQWKSQYFKALPDGTYQAVDKIRQEVVFRVGNLMEPFVFKKPFDIIFCRNVMIYFDHATTQKMVAKFYDATALNGYLCIGHSETVDKNQSNYSYIQPAIYQKRTKGR